MTAADLKAGIETGPLAAALAPFWADVFPHEPEPSDVPLPTKTEPPAADESEAAAALRAEWAAWQTRQRWERISYRFGLLTPDACHHLLRLLRPAYPDAKIDEAALQAAKAVTP